MTADYVRAIDSGRDPQFPDWFFPNDRIPVQAASLIVLLLHTDPAQRLNAAEAKLHPWSLGLGGGNFSHVEVCRNVCAKRNQIIPPSNTHSSTSCVTGTTTTGLQEPQRPAAVSIVKPKQHVTNAFGNVPPVPPEDQGQMPLRLGMVRTFKEFGSKTSSPQAALQVSTSRGVTSQGPTSVAPTPMIRQISVELSPAEQQRLKEQEAMIDAVLLQNDVSSPVIVTVSRVKDRKEAKQI